jgi:hypothetical protein
MLNHAGNVVAKPLALLIVLVGALLVSAVPAAASGDGCAWWASQPRSCVQVVGASTHVTSARGGVNLGPRQSARGHFEVYDTSRLIDFNSSDETYWNQSWLHQATFWGPARTLNRYFPDGDQICAIFWERRGGGYTRHAPACITVRA